MAFIQAMLARHACHLAGADDTAGSADAGRHAQRHAIGLGMLAARDREAALLLLNGQDAPVPVSPWQAAGKLPTADRAPLLWAETIDAQDDAALASDIVAPEHITIAGGVLFRFANLHACLAAAVALAATTRARQQNIRLSMDVEKPEAGRLENALLPKLRPVTPPGHIFATEAAAAEIALAGVASFDPRAVGRVRSSKRMNRIAMWSLTEVAEAARA
jgi:hypothetical protein